MKFKRFFSVILAFLLIMPLVIVKENSPAINVYASGVDNIVSRANYLYNLTWVAQKDVTGWDYTFKKGQTYHVPYGQPATAGKYIYYGVSIDDYMTATKNASSIFYTSKSYYSGNNIKSTYYATDCSGFVSYCWDISRTTTSNWANLDVTSHGKVNSTNISKIQTGDALNLAGSHVVLVTAVNSDGTYEITEQTPPQLKRTKYTASKLISSYSSYTIYRYNKRDSVKPLTGINISSPSVHTRYKYYAPNADIDILWNKIDGAEGYIIDIWRDGKHIISRDLGNVTSFTDTFTGESYEVYVTAYNSYSSAKSEACTFYLKEMIAPTVRTRHKYYAPNADIDILWNKIDGAEGYIIDIWKDGKHIISRDLGNVTSFTDTFTGESYEIYVTAYNNIGGSTKATSKACTFYLKEMTAPEIYAEFESKKQNSNVKIFWNEIQGAVGYIIDIERDGKHIISRDLGVQTTFNDIFTGNEYSVSVTAYNDIGGYTSAQSKTFEFTLNKPGDINSDGKVNTADAVLLQKHLLNAQPLTAEQGTLADINGDNSIDVFDMILLRKLLTD